MKTPVNLRYSAAEQRKRLKEFDDLARKARADWKKGYAFLVLSFVDYTHLLALAGQRYAPSAKLIRPKRRQK